MYATTLSGAPRALPSLPSPAAARGRSRAPIQWVRRDRLRGAEEALFAALFAGFLAMAASFVAQLL